MKKILGIVFLIVLGICLYYSVSSNPLPFYRIINELAFNAQGWILELELPDSVNTNGWFLVSKQDTSRLKPMSIAGNTQYLITKDSLQDSMNIDATGDRLLLYSLVGTMMGSVDFGNSSSSEIAAPRTGQSICVDLSGRYYLDNSSTLGCQNDTLNATGYIIGQVKDKNDLPMKDVLVSCMGGTIRTDSSGFYIISDIACKTILTFYKQKYVIEGVTIQVWPESTVTVNMTMSLRPGESVERLNTQIVPENFSVSEPFPNPFNPETQIQYTLPENSNIRIEVFDINGKLVNKIFSGYQLKGSYRTYWNAANFPSGIYIIRIQTGAHLLSKKCSLIK